MGTDAWQPGQYERFERQRAAPFVRPPGPGAAPAEPRVVDLGCGNGQLTAVLHERLGAAETVGVDASEAMLKGRPAVVGPALRAPRHGRLRRRSTRPAPTSCSRTRRCTGCRITRACSRRSSPCCALGASSWCRCRATRTTPRTPWRGRWRRASRWRCATRRCCRPKPTAPCSTTSASRSPRCHLRVYAHELPSRDEVVEWVKGTTLTYYAARLSPEVYGRFLETYKQRLLEQLPDRRPFLYTFKRLFVVAKKEFGPPRRQTPSGE